MAERVYSQKEMNERFPVDRVLESRLSDIEGPIALALSGGIDSASCLFALQNLGKDVTAYTFTLSDRRSEDFRISKDICEKFGVEFVPVPLPTDIETLKEDTHYLINDVGLSSKTDIECTWPFLYLLESVSEPTLVTGGCADGHFVVSKKGMIHYRDSVAKMDAFRRDLFTEPNYAQRLTIDSLAKERGLTDTRTPYYCQEMVDLFEGTAWEEINKPNQKQPIIDAYPGQMAQFKTRRHKNLQLGEAGIAEHFEKLVETDWNLHDYKSPVGVYNSIERGEVGP